MQITKAQATLLFIALENLMDDLGDGFYYGSVQDAVALNRGEDFRGAEVSRKAAEQVLEAFPMAVGVTELSDLNKHDLINHVRGLAASIGREYGLRSAYDERMNDLIDHPPLSEGMKRFIAAGEDMETGEEFALQSTR